MEFYPAQTRPAFVGIRGYQPYHQNNFKAFQQGGGGSTRQRANGNMSQPGHTPQPGDQGFISQAFHTPSFGDEDFDLNAFAMATEADQASKTMMPQQHPQHQQLQQQQQQQQHQQPQQRTHIYISAPVGHQQAMGGMRIGNINQPISMAQNMAVTNCMTGMVSDAGEDSLAPKFPPQNFDVPDIILSNSVTSSEAGMTSSGAGMYGDIVSGVSTASQPVSNVYYSNIVTSTSVPQMHGRVLTSTSVPPGMYSLLQQQQQQQHQHQQQQQQFQQQQHPPLSTISASQVASQLGFQSAVQSSVSPGSSHSSSPGRESSEDSDDCMPLAQLVSMKRAASGVPMATDTVSMVAGVPADAHTRHATGAGLTESETAGSLSPAKKQKPVKKKKKKDPNEPQKPVSAYALFFRDTQAAIKGQNPSASFGEVSKIVASMWDGLDPAHKEVYKKKTELAKKEYLKQLAAYRASQVSLSAAEEASGSSEKSPSPPSVQPMSISTTSTVPTSAINTMSSFTEMQALQQQQQLQQQQMQQQQLQQQQMQQQLQQQHQQQQSQQHQSPPQMPQQFSSPQTQTEMTAPTFHTLTAAPSTVDPIIPATVDDGLFPQPAVQEHAPSHLNMLCVRDGCHNLAIENPGWDAEYCSNECVVTHCRDIFTAWVAARGGSSSYPVK